MEGEGRKRKLERDEEENEEEKMEKFFALIKSTKDARDQLFNKESKKASEVEDLKKGKGITWTPMFQPEDFIDSAAAGELRNNHVSTAAHAGPSEDDGKGKEVMLQIEQEYLRQAAAITPAVVVAPNTENPHEEKANSDPLDLNLSL